MDLLKDISPELLKALKSTQSDIPPIGLEHITMTEEEKNNMSFNESDQQFIVKLMKRVADNIKGEQANSIAAQNYLIHTILEIVNIEQKKVLEHEEAIGELRTDFETNKKKLEEIAKHKPTLQSIQNVLNFWTRKNWLKIIGLVLGILFVLSLMFAGINAFMHIKKIWGVTFVDGSNHTKLEQIYDNIREGKVNPTVRGGNDYEMTEAEIDSSQAGILRYNIKPISGMKRY